MSSYFCQDCGYLARNRKHKSTHCCCPERCGRFLVYEQIDPEDDGTQWRDPRPSPWAHNEMIYMDVVDWGDSWLIIDGNGMTYGEPKRTIERKVFIKKKHCLGHFLRC